MRWTMIVLLACMALACGDDSVLAPGEVLPVVTLASVIDGPTSQVHMTVSNFGNGHFSYGSCALLVWRQEGDAWAPTPEYGDRHCAASATSLPAGASRSFSVPRPTVDGLNRVLFVARHSDSEHDFGILSAPFGIGIAFAADLRVPSAVQSKPPHLAITR